MIVEYKVQQTPIERNGRSINSDLKSDRNYYNNDLLGFPGNCSTKLCPVGRKRMLFACESVNDPQISSFKIDDAIHNPPEPDGNRRCGLAYRSVEIFARHRGR